MKHSPIAILGAGNMASAVALHLARLGMPVKLYCIEHDVHEEMLHDRCNSKYLAGHSFPKNVMTSPDLVEVVEGASSVWIAVPSFAVADVVKKMMPHLPKHATIVSLTKGLDERTGFPLVETEAHALGVAHRRSLCIVGGPAIANEMAKGSPTAFVIGSHDRKKAKQIAELLHSQTVKACVTKDRVGVGLCSALKNVYAIALGLCDGLKYPTNAKALIMTLAIEEMGRIVAKAGGEQQTVYGLAGLGDLMVSGTSLHGRNRTYGERLVGAKTCDPQALGLGTVEGVAATRAAKALLKHLRIQAPLLETIIRVTHAKKEFEKPFEKYVRELRMG